MGQNRRFSALVSRSGFGAANRCSCVLPFYCVLLFSDRTRMAATRFFTAAAACVMPLRFAAESCKSQCNGSVRHVNGALAAESFGFGKDIFSFKIG